jgi:hypothetical protein
VVNITAIVCKRLVVDNYLSCSFCQIDFRFSAFSLTIAIISVGNFNRLLHFGQSVLCLFKGEEFKLNLRIDCAISNIILINSLPILVENSKVIKVCVAVEIHRHFVETQFEG